MTELAPNRLIDARSIALSFGERDILKGVNLMIGQGEIVTLIGPNGAGKTTTMKMLTGFLPATSGSATVAGFDVFDSPMDVKRSIGYLPEIPPVYPDLTVREYLRFVGKLKGLRGKNLKEQQSG